MGSLCCITVVKQRLFVGFRPADLRTCGACHIIITSRRPVAGGQKFAALDSSMLTVRNHLKSHHPPNGHRVRVITRSAGTQHTQTAHSPPVSQLFFVNSRNFEKFALVQKVWGKFSGFFCAILGALWCFQDFEFFALCT